MDNTALVIKAYKSNIKAHRQIVIYEYDIWPGYFVEGDETKVLELECWEINPAKPPNGFRYQGTKYQYDLRSHNNTRPIAWKVPFLDHPNYNDPDSTLSHLCHNEKCYNWKHHCLENLAYNKARNGCPGGRFCFHTPLCIVPGPFYK